MKGLLLRVGIDTQVGECLAPIFPDSSFEYIPKPETRATSEERVYKSMAGRAGKPFKQFVPAKYWYSHPHYDPEFDTYTYGDPTFPKRSQLSKLRNGDLLIFYAGLELWKNGEFGGETGLYIIGYFTIGDVHIFEKESASWQSFFEGLENNAHYKVYKRLRELGIKVGGGSGNDDQFNQLVIAKGNEQESQLLSKAIPISNGEGYTLPEVADKIGYEGSLVRAVGHWINGENIQGAKELIEEL